MMKCAWYLHCYEKVCLFVIIINFTIFHQFFLILLLLHHPRFIDDKFIYSIQPTIRRSKLYLLRQHPDMTTISERMHVDCLISSRMNGKAWNNKNDMAYPWNKIHFLPPDEKINSSLTAQHNQNRIIGKTWSFAIHILRLCIDKLLEIWCPVLRVCVYSFPISLKFSNSIHSINILYSSLLFDGPSGITKTQQQYATWPPYPPAIIHLYD